MKVTIQTVCLATVAMETNEVTMVEVAIRGNHRFPGHIEI